MSRIPSLSTPHRLGTPPTPSSGIPTPSGRRPRSSLGPASSRTSLASASTADEDAMGELQAALRARPPSAMRQLLDAGDGEAGPDTPTGQSFNLSAPKTPLGRARTPNTLLRPGIPITPGSRARPSMGRPSVGLGASTTTPRRTSMASSTSTTPFARRPESRASAAAPAERFAPQVGDKVRMQSMGMEGTLRFLGPTQFKEGVWAGVELDRGFAGKGKNDGSVDGVEYFDCAPLCGVFVNPSRLSAPTTPVHASRPASVASSHQSQLSGRMTPAHERARPATATPGKARTVSSSVRGASTRLGTPHDPLPSDARPQRTLLGNSTSTNAGIAPKLTAGSRASRYAGMTAKELSAREPPAAPPNLNASVRGIGGTTPKASRASIGRGFGTSTPVRPRGSLGGFATPKARPRDSGDAMPPPPSPGKVRVMAQAAQLEAEVRSLQTRNAALEAKLASATRSGGAGGRSVSGGSMDGDGPGPDVEGLRNDLEAAHKEADELRHHLAQTHEDARAATELAEELLNKEKGYEEDADRAKEEVRRAREEVERLRAEVGEVGGLREEVERVKKEAGRERERAEGEVQAAMEQRKREVRELEERLKGLEEELSEAEGNVEELRAAGQATISLYEQKLSDTETRTYELEDRIRSLEDKLATSESERIRLEAIGSGSGSGSGSGAGSGSTSSPRAGTTALPGAAEIDNETLRTQVAHLQSKLSALEEQLDEARAQLESEAENWRARLDKAKLAEREKGEVVRELQSEVKRLKDETRKGKARVGELEVGMGEVRGALEGARGEIEGLRGEAAEASSLRATLAKSAEAEKALADKTARVAELEAEVKVMDEMKKDCERFEAQVETLRAELASAERRSPRPDASSVGPGNHTLPLPPSPNPDRLSPSPHPPASPRTHARPRLSTGTTEGDEQKMHGYHHVIRELTAENGALKAEVRRLGDEVRGLKEEVGLMEELMGEGGLAKAGEGVKDGAKDKATIKDLEREVAELESLIESKIYQQDDLENRIAELERDLRAARAGAGAGAAGSRQTANANANGVMIGLGIKGGNGDGDDDTPSALAGTAPLRVNNRAPRGSVSPSPAPRPRTAGSTRSRASSATGSTGDEYHDAYAGIERGSGSEDGGASASAGASAEAGAGGEVERCELCEGPHELDACPVFAGNLDAAPKEMGTGTGSGSGSGNKGRRCADCEEPEPELELELELELWLELELELWLELELELGPELMRQSTEHATEDCPLADDVF